MTMRWAMLRGSVGGIENFIIPHYLCQILFVREFDLRCANELISAFLLDLQQ
jgi:hypothetical protein